jgi:hypothetical protein
MLRPLLFFVQAVAASTAIAYPQSQAGQLTAGTAYQVIARPQAAIEAPADVYFGRYKLSNLGVRNAISDMTIEGDSPLALPLQTGRISAVESALPDWANRYPKDPWLPSTIAKFSVFLISKQQPEYDRAALAWLSLLETWYPSTWYGKYARGQLAEFDLIPNIDLESGPTIGQLARVPDRDFPAIGANHRRH